MASGGRDIPSKQDLGKAITGILQGADLTQTSVKKVRKQLEEKFGVDLSSRKHEIDDLVMAAISEQSQEDDEEGEEAATAQSAENEDESDEEEVIQDGLPRKRKRAKADGRGSPKKPRTSSGRVTTSRTSSSERPQRSSSNYSSSFGPMMVLSSDLAAIVEEDKMPKTLVAQKVWAMIQERNLQDSNAKDEKHKHFDKIFEGETDRIQSHNKMMRYLKKQMQEEKKVKSAKTENETDGRKGKSGYAAPMVLSPELAAIVGQPRMARGDVVKKMWQIVKERNLKDPTDGRYHICDDQLLTVFGVRRVYTFRMMKHLAKHMKDGRLCV